MTLARIDTVRACAAARRPAERSIRLRRLAHCAAVVATAAALVGCGGGGGSPNEPVAPAPTPSPGPAPTPSPAPAPGTSVLEGLLRGPMGAQVVLQNKGGDDLSVTVTRSLATSSDHYDKTLFRFTTALADGEAYQVSLKTAPSDQRCSVYRGASGTMLVVAGALRVGCEYTNDLVSRSSDDRVLGTYFDSFEIAIGGAHEAVGSTASGEGEGRFVAFLSSASIAGSTGANRQVFWRDRLTGQTRLVSADAQGAQGNANSASVAISADGQTVAFESAASNLVAGDTNAVRDVFVWNAKNPAAGVQRVSVGANGVQANADSFEPALSGDGAVIAFASFADNLSAGVSGTATANVFRRDLKTQVNTLVSAAADAGPGLGGAKPALSEDGSRIAFHSVSSAIVANDNNGLWDIFLYDATTGTRRRLSLRHDGGERDQGFESTSRLTPPAISGNGRYVAYSTSSTNVVPGDSNGESDVFVVDTQTSSVVRASLGPQGQQGNAGSPAGIERIGLSYDGQWVGFSTSSSNFGLGGGVAGISHALLRNWATGETRALTNNNFGSVGPVALTRRAAYAAFGSAGKEDPRFDSTGLFVHFTGVERAWYWVD